MLFRMTLAAHAATGALLAAFVPEHPVIAFTLGFGSHFLLDAIPHWDYHLSSIEDDEDPLEMKMPFGWNFFFDILKIGLDFALGIIIGCLVFPALFHFPLTTAIVFGAAGATLPDLLTFLYTRFPYGVFYSIMQFHVFVHTEGKIKNWKIGFPLQVAFVLSVCLIFFLVKK